MTDWNEFNRQVRSARLYRAQADLMPNFDDDAKATTREIPVVVPEPR